MKTFRLFGLTVALIFALCLFAKAQDKIISRIPNFPRIARAWNSLGPATKEWNQAMGRADALIHERFNPKVVAVDPDARRREFVVTVKAAREALSKQMEALNELIDEDDY